MCVYNIGLGVQRGSSSHGCLRSGNSSAQIFDGESGCESLVTSDALSQFFWDVSRGIRSAQFSILGSLVIRNMKKLGNGLFRNKETIFPALD
jgi:hypothetical protein